MQSKTDAAMIAEDLLNGEVAAGSAASPMKAVEIACSSSQPAGISVEATI